MIRIISYPILSSLVSKCFSSLLLKATFTLFSNFPLFSFSNSCRIICVFPFVLIFLVKMIKRKIFKSRKITCIFPSVLIYLAKMIERKNITPIKRTRASSYIKGRVSGEFWWWTRSEISKNHRLSCSPSASTRTACPFTLKFCTEFQETLLYKRVSVFFVIVSSSLVLKE